MGDPRAALDVRDLGILSKGYIGEPYNGGTASRTSDLVIKQSGDVNDNSKTSGIRSSELLMILTHGILVLTTGQTFNSLQ